MAYDGVVAKFTVSGSMVSCLATLAVLLYSIASRGKHRSLRHALIFNLVLAEFLNGLNNSVSGFIYVDTHEMHLGPACTANGFFAQMTAQAVDFNILAIVLVTLLTVTRMVDLPNLSVQWKKQLICGSTWVVPFVTSLAAVAVQEMKPIGGNWCWIPLTQLGLRYALAEGWRLAIVLLTITLYAFIWGFVYHRYDILFSPRRTEFTSREHRPKDLVRTKTASPESGYHPRSSGLDAPNQSDAVANRNTIGEQCSEFSLPIQHDANSSIDGRVESISRWIYIRHPGLITSFPHSKSHPQAAATKQNSGPHYHNQCPKVTKSFDVAVDSGRQTVEASPGTGGGQTAGPHYHSQCPKVRKSFNVSVDSAQAPPQPSSATGENQGSGPHYHSQCPKVTKSFDVSIAAPSTGPSDTLPQGNRESGPHYHNQCPKVTKSFDVSVGSAAGTQLNALSGTTTQEAQSPGPHYHNQCPKVTRSFNVAVDDPQTPATPISPGLSEGTQTGGPNYHSQCPKVKRSFGVSFNGEDEIPARPLPPAVPIRSLPSGPHYHSECPKVKRSFSLSSSLREEESKATPGPHYHSQCPKVKRSFEVAVDDTPQESGPHYHNQCPKVKRSFEVSTEDTETSSGPHYHNQCPKVTKSVEVSSTPSGPNYHSQCPKVTKSVEVSSTPSGPNYHSQCPKVTKSVDVSSVSSGPNYHNQCPKVTKSVDISSAPPGPHYHNQCPKVTRSVSVLPSATSPIFPESPTSGFRREACTETTIITSPRDPPPSPTPGLPPPPWSHDSPRRKTFLFSKSSWSDSTTPPKLSTAEADRRVEREIRRTLLLNAYPLAYVILWLPGIVNCFMDARGTTPSNPRVMAALLGTSQYIGLANAITFAVNEFIRRRLKGHHSRKGARPGEKKDKKEPLESSNV